MMPEQKSITLWNVHRQDQFVEQTFAINAAGRLIVCDREGRVTTQYRDLESAKECGWREAPYEALKETIAGHEKQVAEYQGYIKTLRKHLDELL